jgi:nitrite reductase (NAD(P)H)
LLGLEAAKAVYDLPTVPNVSIHIRADYPLNRQLDPSAGDLVRGKIEALGVAVNTQATINGVRIEGDRFVGLTTASGDVPSQMVIFAIGIRPRDDLAVASGIATDTRGGIKVGDDLMSSAQDVYAIGECASWNGNVSQGSGSANASSTASSHRVLKWQTSSHST